MELLKPPAPLNTTSGDLNQSFKEWKQKFQLYYTASGADEKLTDKQKCALLLHSIGDDGLAIYNNFENKENLKYEEILKKIELHCSPPTNETYNRHLFFSRKQKASESFDEFLTAIKKLSQDCNFEKLRDGLIRDQIILGIHDNNLKENLLRITDLNLEKCISTCRIAETAKAQFQILNSENKEVAMINKDKNYNRGRSSARQRSQDRQAFQPRRVQSMDRQESSTNNKPFACRKCGKKHSYRRCPAFNKKCVKCGKYGHFGAMCFNKCATVLLENNQSQDSFQINSVNIIGSINRDWQMKLKVRGMLVQFKIDTGSQVDILHEEFCKRFNLKITKCQDIRLNNFDGSRIKVIGVCHEIVAYGDKECKTTFYIVNCCNCGIISYNTAIKLGILNKVDQINIKNPNVIESYSDLFSGLGELNYEYKIKLSDNCVPIAERPRKIPFKLEPRVKQELDKLESLNVIRKVTEPTEWVNSMVVTKKPGDKIRICLDPQNLNKCIVRERYRIKTFEELVARMPRAKYFSVLDASKGFYMIKLSEDCQLLTTFNAGNFGRYCYKRLPFGLNSAPEVFSKCFSDLFKDIKGVELYIDELIIWGETLQEHNERVEQVLQKARLSGVKFNKEKCQFGVKEVKFIGHIISADGIKPDPEKVRAIIEMDKPKDKKQLQTILGIVTYVSKFIPNLSDVTFSLRELLKKDSVFTWGDKQNNDFIKLKECLTSKPILKYFDIEKPITLSVDSSSTGLGAVLLQDNAPVAYASKALTDCQRSWAQIEKELLAIVYACEKFHQYIYGRHVLVETDHKPLESIFKKSMNETPLRLQRLRLRLQGYDLEIKYRPGKELLIADALSRAYVKDNICNKELDDKVELHVCMVKECINISKERLEELKSHTAKDEDLLLLITYIKNSWPNVKDIPFNLRYYYSIKDELCVSEGLIFKNTAVLVPKSLRKNMLNKIHYNHQGIEKCKNRIRGLLFWPFMIKELEDMISNCDLCLKYSKNHSFETLKLRNVGDKPWAVIGADMFFLNNKIYLLTIDYLTKYVELIELKDQSAECHILALKTVFSRWGIPEILYTDDGAQYKSHLFKDFCSSWNFKHIHSSPYYARSNGMVERHIQTIKKMFKKCIYEKKDIYLALLEYRNTPIDCKLKSPNELMFGRQVSSFLPVNNENVINNYNKVKKYVENKQNKYKYFHDKKYNKRINNFYNGQNVFIHDKNSNKKIEGKILSKEKDRCYKILLKNGEIVIRNKYHVFKGSSHKKVMPYCNDKFYSIDENEPSQNCNSNYNSYKMYEQPSQSSSYNNNNNKKVTFNLDLNTEHKISSSNVSSYGRALRKPQYLQEYV